MDTTPTHSQFKPTVIRELNDGENIIYFIDNENPNTSPADPNTFCFSNPVNIQQQFITSVPFSNPNQQQHFYLSQNTPPIINQSPQFEYLQNTSNPVYYTTQIPQCVVQNVEQPQHVSSGFGAPILKRKIPNKYPQPMVTAYEYQPVSSEVPVYKYKVFNSLDMNSSSSPSSSTSSFNANTTKRFKVDCSLPATKKHTSTINRKRSPKSQQASSQKISIDQNDTENKSMKSHTTTTSSKASYSTSSSYNTIHKTPNISTNQKIYGIPNVKKQVISNLQIPSTASTSQEPVISTQSATYSPTEPGINSSNVLFSNEGGQSKLISNYQKILYKIKLLRERRRRDNTTFIKGSTLNKKINNANKKDFKTIAVFKDFEKQIPNLSEDIIQIHLHDEESLSSNTENTNLPKPKKYIIPGSKFPCSILKSRIDEHSRESIHKLLKKATFQWENEDEPNNLHPQSFIFGLPHVFNSEIVILILIREEGNPLHNAAAASKRGCSTNLKYRSALGESCCFKTLSMDILGVDANFNPSYVKFQIRRILKEFLPKVFAGTKYSYKPITIPCIIAKQIISLIKEYKMILLQEILIINEIQFQKKLILQGGKSKNMHRPPKASLFCQHPHHTFQFFTAEAFRKHFFHDHIIGALELLLHPNDLATPFETKWKIVNKKFPYLLAGRLPTHQIKQNFEKFCENYLLYSEQKIPVFLTIVQHHFFICQICQHKLFKPSGFQRHMSNKHNELYVPLPTHFNACNKCALVGPREIIHQHTAGCTGEESYEDYDDSWVVYS